jgi:hypothetical protein
VEINSLRQQITSIINRVDPTLKLECPMNLYPPTPSMEILLRQLILVGFIDQVFFLYEMN